MTNSRLLTTLVRQMVLVTVADKLFNVKRNYRRRLQCAELQSDVGLAFFPQA